MTDLMLALQNGIVLVKFTKKDGSLREMLCTLSADYLPVIDVGSERANKNPDVISVWDIEANGWRSFNKLNVIEFQKQPLLYVA